MNPSPPEDLILLAPGRFFGLATAVVLAWLIFQVGSMTAHVFNATRFILYDQGSYLYAVGRWQTGEALYRDFAWQYGPLALGWYRAFAAVGGNSPLTLVVASSVAFALAWMMVARLVVKVAGSRWGGVLAVAGLLPVMSASGPYAINGPHGAIEMLLLATIAWTLAAGTGGRLRPWQLGVLVGLLQWVRFGPHLMALAGVLIIAAWQRWLHVAGARAFAHELGAFAWRLLAGYALTIVPLAVWFFNALPSPGAGEQLWPAYMVAHYPATYPHRWPQISSAADWGLIWLPALLGVGLALLLLVASFSRSGPGAKTPAAGAGAGLIFFPLYYALGCVGLFHNDYAIIGHLWLAWPGLALVALLTRGWMRAVVVIAVAPALLATLADIWTAAKAERAWSAQSMVLPNGQSLWFRPAEAKQFGRLQEALGSLSPVPRVAVFLAGGGIHHFFGTQRIGRHWWFLPEFVRPWELEPVQQALLQHDLILVADLGQAADTPLAPRVLSLWLPLPKTIAEQLLPHLKNPRHIESVGDLLQVQP